MEMDRPHANMLEPRRGNRELIWSGLIKFVVIIVTPNKFSISNPGLRQWRIQDGAFGANAPPPPLQEIAYKIEIL